MNERIFKFRAWDKKHKRMMTIFAISSIGKVLGWDGIKEGWIPIKNEDDLILFQFTGLKDKNGEEIYEGDIYRNKKGEDAVIRNFIQDTFHLEEYLMMGGNVSVIGNIFQNKELLNDNKISKTD